MREREKVKRPSKREVCQRETERNKERERERERKIEKALYIILKHRTVEVHTYRRAKKESRELRFGLKGYTSTYICIYKYVQASAIVPTKQPS